MEEKTIIRAPFGMPLSLDYKAQEPHLEAGTVAVGTLTTLKANNVAWEVDEWVDKVAKIYKNGSSDFYFGIIKSNTADTLTFDDNLIFEPCENCTFDIIYTVNIEYFEHLLFAANIQDHDMAFVLPNVTKGIERYSVRPYIEIGNGADEKYCAVMARGTNRILGAKYGTLQYRGEMVELIAHTWGGSDDAADHPHWDLGNEQRIQRGFDTSVDTDTLIDAVEFEAILTPDNTEPGSLRRFFGVDNEGDYELRYTSLVKTKFHVMFKAIISKVGGGAGDAEIAIAKRDADGDLTILDARKTETRYGAGEGKESFTCDAYVFLSRNEQVFPVVLKAGAGTFTLIAGSTFDSIQI